MLAPSRSAPYGTTFSWLCLSLLGVTVASAREPISRPTPPQEPSVPPSITRHFLTDKNSNRIQDSLADRALGLEAKAKNPTRPADRIDAHRSLDEFAEVELIFSRQISQRHLDDFLAANGEVTHIYEAVSYGWNGRLPLGKIRALAASLGDALVQIEENRPAVLHLDQATSTGRVRPIWAAGFAGNVSGFDGDTNITISVLDTGVDGTHMDLNGRNVFWDDYTTDNEPSPYDLIQHGTHVAGIALSSGASAGLATGNLQFTDEGDLTGVSAGSFFPTPFGLSPVSTTVNLVATWLGGGSTTLHLVYHTKGTASGYAAQASITGTSPLTLTTTFTPFATRAYSAALTAAASVGAFNVKAQVTSFDAIGDGFNKLRGVSPGCNWAGAKVFSNSGSGSSLDINAGIDGLVANRVANNIKVMNISLGIIGTPGISAAQRAKVNTAVNNGILVVCSAGNDGTETTTGEREIDDPGRAALALTVGAANDVNQLTDYTSIGFSTQSSTSGQEEDFKPDLMAPGGSAGYYTSIMSVDSNSGDGPAFADQRTNDYYNIQGTSMSTPFVAGCAALVIDALQQRGTNWSFNSSQHPRLVKMLLCATTTESNANRDSAANNPTLQRAAAGPSSYPIGKDPHEGYGNANPDAAVEAVSLAYNFGNVAGDTFGGTANDKRAWARSVQLPAGANFNVSLAVPSTGDFDLHLYSRTPSAFGTPILLASSTVAGLGADETFNYTPSITTNVILVVKRVSGNGTFSLVGTGPITANFSATPTNGSAPLVVTFTNLSSGATNYSWAFGDGNVSSDVNPTNTYASPGVYSVTLTALGATGSNTLTRTSYISVTNPPGTFADFSASPISGVPPLMVTFNNLSGSATNYSWDFGDGDSSTDTNVVHTYTNTGIYTVALTAVGDTGTNTFTRTNYITVTNFLPVTVNFAAAPLSGAAPLLVSFTNLSTQATNHLWDFGDGGFSSGVNPSHTFTNSGLFTITLTSTGPGGTNSFTRTDYVSASNAPPAIVTHPTSLVITQGTTALFTVTATGSALQYQWRKCGVDLPTANSTTLTITNTQPPDIGTYSVIVTNSSGSVTSSNATLALVTAADAIIVTGPPYLENFNSIGSGGTTSPHGWFVGTGTGAVAGKTVTVSSGAANSGGNYNYGSTGNSDRALGSLASSTTQRDTEARFINLSGSTITALAINYTGEQWRVGGNGSANNTLVMQYSLDGASFTTMGGGFDFNTPVDSGSASSLNGNSAANRVTNLGGTFEPAGAIPDGQVFYLRWADVDNASADHAMAVDDFAISFTLSNPPPPVVTANFSADITEGLAPLTVNFTNLSANATNYSWNFGDGNTSTLEHPENTFTNAGSFSVTLEAIGAGGTNTVTFTNYITVTNAPPPPAPVASFIADITEGLAPLIVNFTNLSANATNYSWNFGDGNTSSLEHPANIFTNAGSFSVTLEAIGVGGTNTVTFTNYITATNAPPPPEPVANFSAEPTNGLAPLAVTFTNLSTGATSYLWNFGDLTTSTNQHPLHTYTNAGSYSVTLTAVGLGGTNSVTFTNYITASNYPPVIANFTGAPTNGLAPLAVTFTNLSTGATSYSWNFGDLITSTNQHPLHTYTNAGSFTVTLIATGLGGTNSVTFTNYITATNAPPPPAPVANFIADFTEGLAPLTVNFTNLSANATNYSWNFGDGNVSTLNHPATAFTNAGSFSVTLEAIGAGGTNTVTFTNYIVATNTPPPPSPVASFVATITNGLAPLVVAFTNLSANATDFTWDFGDGNVSTNQHPFNTYTNAGSFTVTLTAVGFGGTNSVTFTNYITATNYLPVIADFSAEPTNGLAPLVVTFTNFSSNATDFSWDFGDGNTSTNQHPLNTYANAGNFTVTLIAIGLGGTNSFTFTNYITVTNLPPMLVVTPESLNLGTVLTEAWSHAIFTVSNAGGLLLNANTTVTTDPFFLLDANTNLVASVAFTVPALAATNLTMRFKPSSEGAFSNVVVFVTDGGSSTNVVTGFGFGTPVIVQLTYSETEFTFSFATVPGKIYEVQYKDTVDAAIWQTLQFVPGDGSLKTVTNLTDVPAQRFYRLIVP